jgi:SAM-dependent methyltransferase
MLDTRLFSKLRCPACTHSLAERAGQLQCTNCGNLYNVTGHVPDFLPSSAAGNAQTFDYLSHYKKDAEAFDYFEQRFGATEHAERRLHEYILAELPARRAAVLDVGCGSAWLAQSLQGEDVLLCSFDATLVNTRKALELYPWSGHTAVAGDAFNMPFKDGSFDVIVASEIIEHVPDPLNFVRELVRVLTPGGRILITTPYKEVLKYTLCIHCGEVTPLNAHLHSFDERVLTNVGTQAGASRVTSLTFGNKVLSYLRTYTLLRYLPHAGWRLIDSLANSVYNAPANLLLKIEK